ncbi:hypothetical protein DKX38_024881 [Salix brachista]|uniref:Uncharacterized protein n=1 Tax=Salix brachista TaxID=2182728 RepID=A0A5N5JND2_9ROSI|nr:hypothetical protein DKX38_024881 [Salix brachista]
MFEESVCRLLQASWFMTLTVEDHEDVYEDPEEFMILTMEDHEDVYEDPEDYYPYEFEDGDDDLDEVYLNRSSNLCIGNRRWGDNGYVRAGRQEARPVYQADFKDSGAGSSSEPNKKKEASKDRTGRRAKRTLKREAADKAAAAKHQQHLASLGTPGRAYNQMDVPELRQSDRVITGISVQQFLFISMQEKLERIKTERGMLVVGNDGSGEGVLLSLELLLLVFQHLCLPAYYESRPRFNKN